YRRIEDCIDTWTAVEPPARYDVYCLGNLFPTINGRLTPLARLCLTQSTQMSGYNLTHLKQLEAESIHILREVAAEFENPVMLYSIGKDSAVMLHLALKAFYPSKPPFPLMH